MATRYLNPCSATAILRVDQANVNQYSPRVEQYLHDRHANKAMVVGSDHFYGQITCINETKLNINDTKLYLQRWKERGGAGFASEARGKQGGMAILFHAKLNLYNGTLEKGEDPNVLYDKETHKEVGEFIAPPMDLHHRLLAVRFSYSGLNILLVAFYAPQATYNIRGKDGIGRASTPTESGCFARIRTWLESELRQGDELWLCGDKNCTPKNERKERTSVQSCWPAAFYLGHDEIVSELIDGTVLADRRSVVIQ